MYTEDLKDMFNMAYEFFLTNADKSLDMITRIEVKEDLQREQFKLLQFKNEYQTKKRAIEIVLKLQQMKYGVFLVELFDYYMPKLAEDDKAEYISALQNVILPKLGDTYLKKLGQNHFNKVLDSCGDREYVICERIFNQSTRIAKQIHLI